MELEAQNAENEEDISEYYRQFDDPMNGEKSGANEAELNKQNSVTNAQQPDPPQHHPTLPWQPKVRTKDIYQFMDISRRKFIGYSLPDNCETTAGLPKPICEGINILKRVNPMKKFNRHIFHEIFLALVHEPCRRTNQTRRRNHS